MTGLNDLATNGCGDVVDDDAHGDPHVGDGHGRDEGRNSGGRHGSGDGMIHVGSVQHLAELSGELPRVAGEPVHRRPLDRPVTVLFDPKVEERSWVNKSPDTSGPAPTVSVMRSRSSAPVPGPRTQPTSQPLPLDLEPSDSRPGWRRSA